MNTRFLRSVPPIWFCLFILMPTPIGMTAERAAEKIRITVSSKSLGFLDTWAARERGFYRKQGLERR